MQPVILDIETIPDESRIPTWKEVKCPKCDHSPENRSSREKKDYCAECESKWALKWPTAQVICVTTKIFEGEMQTFCTKNESALLGDAYDFLESLSPINPYVVFNGQDFDIPVLRLRGLIHRVPFIDILPRGRYPRNLVDVYMDLTEGKWNKDQAASLEMICAMLGYKDLLYGKGSQVGEWFKAGEMDKIAKHNQGDVLALEAIYRDVVGISKCYRSDVETIKL